MEYITVSFPGRQRDVYVDGEVSGLTNETFGVEKGTHTINLGEPRNYAPKWRRPKVEMTTPVAPMEIEFEKA